MVDGVMKEGDAKKIIRDGVSVAEVVVLVADMGSGIQYFPFLRMVGSDAFFGIRKARGNGLVSFAQINPLVAKLRAEPTPDASGGFAWKGDRLDLVFPGNKKLQDIPAAARWVEG